MPDLAQLKNQTFLETTNSFYNNRAIASNELQIKIENQEPKVVAHPKTDKSNIDSRRKSQSV
jgi:hypothetical protein